MCRKNGRLYQRPPIRDLISVQNKSAMKEERDNRVRLGVVIINYRTPNLTIDCLGSLAGDLEQVDGEVVVVDNCSGDGSAEKIEQWISTSSIAKRTRLLRSQSNSGFSGGNNQGVAALNADFYLLLNSDTRIRGGALSALLASAAQHPQAGAIGPRLEDEDATIQQSAFRFISPMSEFLGAASSRPVSRLLKHFEVALPVGDAPVTCDWVSFACILLRREAVEAAGLMDDGYFMYFEDADYCNALLRAGWRTFYDPVPRVIHLRGGSSPVKLAIARRARPPAYYYAARMRYFRKKFGPLGPAAANFAWYAGRAIAWLRPLGGKPVPPACKNQAIDIWTNWRAPLSDRKAPEAGS